MLVRTSARPVLFILLAAALALTACNIGSTPAPTVDVNAISTAAYNTAAAQIFIGQTQTALVAPSATLAPTNTFAPLATVNGTALASPTLGTPATISFNSVNTTPNAPLNNTPLPGFTALASPAAPAGQATTALGDACSNNQFVADVTIPDNTVFEAGNKDYRPGHEFQKIWRVKNTGNCKWDDGFQLVFIGGDSALEPHTVKLDDPSEFVDPGETIDLGVNLMAPSAAGTYTATWRMQNDRGAFFGTPLTVVIEVRKH